MMGAALDASLNTVHLLPTTFAPPHCAIRNGKAFTGAFPVYTVCPLGLATAGFPEANEMNKKQLTE